MDNENVWKRAVEMKKRARIAFAALDHEFYRFTRHIEKIETTHLAEQGFVRCSDHLTLIVVVINEYLYYRFFVCTCGN